MLITLIDNMFKLIAINVKRSRLTTCILNTGKMAGSYNVNIVVEKLT